MRKPFKMKSGNSPMFKNMGSPVKQKMSLQMYKATGGQSEADWRADLKEGKTYRERKESRKWGRAEDLTKDREKAEGFAEGIDLKQAPEKNVRRSAKNIARLRKKEAMAEIKAKRYSGRPDRAKGESYVVRGRGSLAQTQRKRARKARKEARREFRQEKRDIRRTGGYDMIKELQND